MPIRVRASRWSGATASLCMLCTYLDTYILLEVYCWNGIRVRNNCGAEPPRDIEPPGLVRTDGRRDRATASYAAADRVEAPASAARCRFRGIHGGRAAASLPIEAGTISGSGCLAGSVSPVLVPLRGCSRTPPRPHGSVDTNERDNQGETSAAPPRRQGKRRQPMNSLLWVLQIALAFLYVSGGAYKVIKVDELANHVRGLPRSGWRALGVFEMLGGILLVIPAAASGIPTLTALAAAALAVETLALAAIYARKSLKLVAANPLVWAAAMGVLAVFVAWGRYALLPLA